MVLRNIFSNKFVAVQLLAALLSSIFLFSGLAHSEMNSKQAAKTKFKKQSIQVGAVHVTAEIADTEEKQMQGLMFRESLTGNNGMLFVFPNEEPRSFWMKNTIIDLSIAYISAKKVIIDIQEMKATSLMEVEPPAYPSNGPAMYALEMPKNWFEKNKIKVGDKIKLK